MTLGVCQPPQPIALVAPRHLNREGRRGQMTNHNTATLNAAPPRRTASRADKEQMGPPTMTVSAKRWVWLLFDDGPPAVRRVDPFLVAVNAKLPVGVPVAASLHGAELDHGLSHVLGPTHPERSMRSLIRFLQAPSTALLPIGSPLRRYVVLQMLADAVEVVTAGGPF